MSNTPSLALTVLSPEARLAAVASALYGDEWARPVARITDIALRTCQRVQASIREGQPDQRAASILEALGARLAVLGAGCVAAEAGLYYQTAIECEDFGSATAAFVARLRQQIAPADGDDYGEPERDARAVALWDADVSSLLTDLGDAESLMWRLLRFGTAVHRDDADDDDFTEFANAVYYAAAELSVAIAQDLDGAWHIYGPPTARCASDEAMSLPVRPVLAFPVRDDGFRVPVIEALQSDPSVLRAFSAIDYLNIVDAVDKGAESFPVIVELTNGTVPAAVRERLARRVAWWTNDPNKGPVPVS